jgi:hypothetical protein
MKNTVTFILVVKFFNKILIFMFKNLIRVTTFLILVLLVWFYIHSGPALVVLGLYSIMFSNFLSVIRSNLKLVEKISYLRLENGIITLAIE